MATVNVNDTLTFTESVNIWTFARSVSDTITTGEYANVQLDTGYLRCLFNNDNINDIPNLWVNAIELYDQANRSLQSYPLARADGLKLVNAQYELKTVTIDGFIAASSRVLFETARDALLEIVEPQEATLRFSQSGADRNYTCTLSDVVWNEKPGGGFATFSLKFACSDPFGYDTSSTTDVNVATITTSANTQTFTAVGGTYKALPTLTLTLNSGTGLTGAINLADQSGSTISVSRTWVAGDILIVNCATQAVTVNGTTVDYTGVFPNLMTGDTHVIYSDGLTTRNVTLTVTHRNRFK